MNAIQGFTRGRFIVYSGEPVVYRQDTDAAGEVTETALCRCEEVKGASWIADQLNALDSVAELLVRLGWAQALGE